MKWKKRADGIVLEVKVIPKAANHALVGWEGDLLKVRVAAVPEKGQVNKELIAFLAEILETAKSNLLMIAGMTSRHKHILIKTLDQQWIEDRIEKELSC
jgi:uncharacterized protein (TIGR00251 family)